MRTIQEIADSLRETVSKTKGASAEQLRSRHIEERFTRMYPSANERLKDLRAHGGAIAESKTGRFANVNRVHNILSRLTGGTALKARQMLRDAFEGGGMAGYKNSTWERLLSCLEKALAEGRRCAESLREKAESIREKVDEVSDAAWEAIAKSAEGPGETIPVVKFPS